MLDSTNKTVTRDWVVLFVNGQRHEIRGADAFLTLSTLLRERLRLVGTKLVCEEGDCGSCTVLMARLGDAAPRYHPIDSCIAFVHQLDGCHVVTIEGLAADDRDSLTPIQQSMVDCHGSQCGFCTPGFVMAMTALAEQQLDAAESIEALSDDQLRQGLTGNLCRCTGYVPIFEAGRETDWKEYTAIERLYPSSQFTTAVAATRRDELSVEATVGGKRVHLLGPTCIDRVCELRAQYPDARLIAGATDVGVQRNKGAVVDDVCIDLNRVAELEQLAVVGGHVEVGARVTWQRLHALFVDELPEFASIISVFGSPQIRFMGTLGGNLANASPIADSIPLLYVLEAQLSLRSNAGTRSVNINDFYQGYKDFDLRSDEFIESVTIPLPAPHELLRLYKVSRRRDLDISTFTAAICCRTEKGVIEDIALAFGAVGPIVLRARQAEKFLIGKPLDIATMQQAGDIAVTEITPISDVRGSRDYRYQLTRNVLLKFVWETQELASA